MAAAPQLAGRTGGQINECIINIGCVGSGKSTQAVKDGLSIAARHDAQLVIHDLGGSAIRDAKRFGQVDYAIYRSPTATIKPSRVHLLNTGEAEDLFPFAERLRQRKTEKLVFLVDEIVAAKEILPSYIGEPWRSALARRRWEGIGFIFVMQSPTMASRFLTGVCNKVRLFRLEHEDDLKAAKKLGFTDEQLRHVRALGRGQFIEKIQQF